MLFMLLDCKYRFLLNKTLPITLTLLCISHAFGADINQFSAEELQRQQQRLDEQQRQQNNRAMVDLQSSTPLMPMRFPDTESPCFPINQITMLAQDSSVSLRPFRSAMKDIKFGQNSVLGRCVGVQGVQYIVSNVQNELIKMGYVTTQVTVQPQDITDGSLELTLIVGQISQRYRTVESDPKVQLYNALPARFGQVLNLSDIEQGLENFRRLSSVQAEINIAPANTQGYSQQVGHPVQTTDADIQGYSDLIIGWKQSNPLLFSASLDDTGSKGTGKYQAGVGLGLENPLQINDDLQLNYSHALDGLNQANGSNESLSATYRVPYQYWLFTGFFNQYDYQQTLAGLNQPIIYRGLSKQIEFGAQRVIHRGIGVKTSVDLKLRQQQSQNFLDDVEVGVQKRRSSEWSIGLKHQHRFTNSALLNGQLNYQHGLGAFDALQPPEVLFNEGVARPIIWTANLQFGFPFMFHQTPIRYQATWRGQYTPNRLIAQDRFAIGSRYSVRGYDGDLSLSGDQGHLLQQELSWSTLIPQSELYLGLDRGWVNGPSTQYLDGHHLTGGVMGIRSYWHGLSLDVFAGKPLGSPRSFNHHATAGFSLNWSN